MPQRVLPSLLQKHAYDQVRVGGRLTIFFARGVVRVFPVITGNIST